MSCLTQAAVLLGGAAPKPQFPERISRKHLHQRIAVVKGGSDAGVGVHGADQTER